MKGVDTNGYQEIKKKTQEYAQNVKAPIGISQERKNNNINGKLPKRINFFFNNIFRIIF